MSTSLSATIMEILERIFGADREEFLENPEQYLADNGLDNISCDDFDDVLVSFLENTNTEYRNERGDVNQGGSFENNTGGGHVGPTVPHHGQSDHEAIAEHLTTVVHEYGDTFITNDDRDTYNDQSFQGTIISDGDVTFDNDIVSASGDGAVAAGDDIDGNVVTGDDNIIGNNNQVGDGAFGDGAIQGGVTVDDGGAFGNNGGSASGSQDDNSTTDNSDNSDNSVTDNSDNSDNSIDVDVEDSFQDNDETTTTTDNSIEVEVEDSFQDNDQDNDTTDNSIDVEVDDVLSNNTTTLDPLL
jgi:hypothetical protein